MRLCYCYCALFVVHLGRSPNQITTVAVALEQWKERVTGTGNDGPQNQGEPGRAQMKALQGGDGGEREGGGERGEGG